jgi:competence protein ComEA
MRAGDAPTPSTVTVHVAGRVRRPGVVTLPGGARVADAIAAAGGLRPDARGVQLNLAALLVDGERVEVRRGDQGISAGARGGHSGGVAEPPAQTTIININTATASQLETLPGVGPVLAGRIISWREINGLFPSVETLGEVAGIGPVLLENLRPLIAV